MKLNMAIIFGVLIWILTNCIASIFHPIFNNNLPYFNILIPILTIITTVFFGIIYIRNVDENEVVEGVLAGVVFCLVNLILDLLIFIFSPSRFFIPNFPMHIASMIVITLLITTFLGYLAQMKIDLR